jgi:hypothetical protein
MGWNMVYGKQLIKMAIKRYNNILKKDQGLDAEMVLIVMLLEEELAQDMVEYKLGFSKQKKSLEMAQENIKLYKKGYLEGEI